VLVLLCLHPRPPATSPLSLHDALPICDLAQRGGVASGVLADVQAHQEQAEAGRAAQAVEQLTLGDHAHAAGVQRLVAELQRLQQDRKSTRLNSSHVKISYAVFCLKKKK